MSANVGDTKHAAMNCYFPMPFAGEARIEVVNESDLPIGAFYFYIDYELLPTAPDDHGRFHAKWRRENPTDGWVPVEPQVQPDTWQGGEGGRAINLTDRENYLFVEARGRGHFVGVNLSVHNLCGGWWGEGDDMFMIDGEKWPTSPTPGACSLTTTTSTTASPTTSRELCSTTTSASPSTGIISMTR
jgi:hypothetical protein